MTDEQKPLIVLKAETEPNPEHRAICQNCGKIIGQVNIRFDAMPILERFMVMISCKECNVLLAIQIATKSQLFGDGRVVGLDTPGGPAIPPGIWGH